MILAVDALSFDFFESGMDSSQPAAFRPRRSIPRGCIPVLDPFAGMISDDRGDVSDGVKVSRQVSF